MNFGVLVSGRGTNLGALLAAQERGKLAPARLACVLSNKADAKALDRAKEAGLPTAVVRHQDYPDRKSFEDELLRQLRDAQAEAVVLAGFMRVLTDHFVDAFPHRILNTHPALCPAFPGMDAATQALAYGVKITGCTIHLVDRGVDTGPIVMQAAVTVKSDDTAADLQKRIQKEEHRLLPEAVRLLASGHLQVTGRHVRIVQHGK